MKFLVFDLMEEHNIEMCKNVLHEFDIHGSLTNVNLRIQTVRYYNQSLTYTRNMKVWVFFNYSHKKDRRVFLYMTINLKPKVKNIVHINQ